MGTVCDNVVRFRIDSETKAKAAEALDCMGLTISDAMRITLRRISEEGRLPFDVEIPNARTRRAIRDMREGRTTRFETVEEALKDLGL
ncbi:type II toxin-antitoxin system RelB/DinJ family antitoxin [Synergistes jonesii]|uniref:Translation repressor RelB n=1 Tax=Synergistes jonesii TaxID=2754 RepID=A0A073ISN5_9BACT|nr:type II toxin-antitoxin system RelB/DinJ family antitoxin [Synergistes jonesii]KEJ93363.1 translation repressor RelB [Synergistes jonesii]MDY2983828.1 type II toxin-antitoxin system RelB/DinJ family antitoxin [Synergistes jonesii]OFB65117.1 translation repressor RelB [Synergistes jonesii]OFB65936.1 translation repressor RelB [Synergistes jonesii]OFB66391.1 translation repressor RelB [Synergistes jonesii]